MPSDREALIAGIAADPDNDLRRLVFADWLEEHGEPERAEFIRLQIEAFRQHMAGEPIRGEIRGRTSALFLESGWKWVGPFLTALDPSWRTTESYRLRPSAPYADIVPQSLSAEQEFVCRTRLARGFIDRVRLRLSNRPEQSDLTEALREEPVTRLEALLTRASRQWFRFSDPALRHITDLSLREETAGGPLVTAHEVFADLHLPAVRRFDLAAIALHLDDSSPPLPLATVQVFANSPLAYRVSDLTLRLDDTGLRALSRSHALRPEKLTLLGTFAAEGIRPLVAADFAPALRSLTLGKLDTGAVAALAKGERFARLTELTFDLTEQPLAALRVLASARFLPQLERLFLSGDERMGEADPDSPGARALADALNPDRLQQLTLSGCGFAEPPPCLVAKFGDRVTV